MRKFGVLTRPELFWPIKWMAVHCHQAGGAGPGALCQRSAPSSLRTALGELTAVCQQRTVRTAHGQSEGSPPQASPRGLGWLHDGAEVSHPGVFLLLALFLPPPLVSLAAGLGRGLRCRSLVKGCGLHILEDVSLDVTVRVH